MTLFDAFNYLAMLRELNRLRKLRMKKRRYYVRPAHLLHEPARFPLFRTYYQSDDRRDLQKFLRLSRDAFDDLHSVLEEKICKARTHRFPLSSKERLAVFLRFAAHESSIHSLESMFGIGCSTAHAVIKEVTAAINERLISCMPTLSEDFLRRRAEEFHEKWNFPHCLGALDGKHFEVKEPPGQGSLYFNHLHFNSIVGLAWVDAQYRFILLDIGAPGRCSDSQIYNASPIAEGFFDGTYRIPPPARIGNLELPFVVVADQGFRLSDVVMRPFNRRDAARDEHKREFNKRLSRARRVSENCFGILVNRFRVLQSPLYMAISEAQKFVAALALLHNWIRSREIERGEEPEYLDPNAAPISSSTPSEHPAPSSSQGIRTRELFTRFFSSAEGHIDWNTIH